VSLGFDLHPVIIEDIMDVDQRPKLEILDDYIYLVLKMLKYDQEKKKAITEQVSIVIAEKFVLTFQQGIGGDSFNTLRTRIRNDKSRIRELGTDYLGYALIDAIIDDYFKVLEIFGDKIENLNVEVADHPTTKTLEKITKMKKIMKLKKVIWPLREAVSNLERGESHLIKKSTRIYLRDLYDHVVQVIDSMETYRDTLSSMMDIYLSSVSNRTNSVMKVLTIITTIFMPLAFLTGLFGMNFKYMPLVEATYGFDILLFLMSMVVLSMVVYFRKKEWL
jgi:magnesium transporter